MLRKKLAWLWKSFTWLRKKLAWGYLVYWFAVWGISWILSMIWGIANQGNIFVWLHIGSILMYYFLLMIMSLIVGGKGEKLQFPFLQPSIVVLLIIVGLLISWGASQLYEVNFALAYQLVSLGQSMTIPKIRMKKK